MSIKFSDTKYGLGDMGGISFKAPSGDSFTDSFNTWYDYGTAQGYADLTDVQKVKVNSIFEVIDDLGLITNGTLDWFYLPMIEDKDRATLNLIDPTQWQNIYLNVANHIPNYGYISVVASSGNKVANAYTFGVSGTHTGNTDVSYGAVGSIPTGQAAGNYAGREAFSNGIVARTTQNPNACIRLWSSNWLGVAAASTQKRTCVQCHKIATQDYRTYIEGLTEDNTTLSDVSPGRVATFGIGGNTGVNNGNGLAFYGASFRSGAQTLETAINTYISEVLLSDDDAATILATLPTV